MRVGLIIFLIVSFNHNARAQDRRTIGYDGTIGWAIVPSGNVPVKITVNILKDAVDGILLYGEIQRVKTDSAGRYHLEIGGGTSVAGQYDSIIWSDGALYIQTVIDSIGSQPVSFKHNMLLRTASDLNNDFEQGTVSATNHPDFGEWKFINTRKRRPKIITVDLTTSYANLAYPANTYPVYRHYEWSDPDRDGKGNSFCISYSDHTNNYFRESTDKLGDVQLYSEPFQELTVSSGINEIAVSISRPVAVKSHGEVYAIKGPWKFIYYIEW